MLSDESRTRGVNREVSVEGRAREVSVAFLGCGLSVVEHSGGHDDEVQRPVRGNRQSGPDDGSFIFYVNMRSLETRVVFRSGTREGVNFCASCSKGSRQGSPDAAG